MPEAFKDLALSLCFAAVVCGIISILSPTGGQSKALGFVVSVFFLFCLVSPFSKIDFSGFEELGLQIDPLEEGGYTKSYEELLIKEFSSNVQKLIEDKLSEQNIMAEDVQIFINKNEDGSIQISEVKLRLSDGNDQESARKAVAELLKIEESCITVSDK